MPQNLANRIVLCLSVLLAHNALAIELTEDEQAFIVDNPTIIVGGEMDWPPMDYVQDGKYTGAALDFLNEIEKVTGLEFQVITGYTWSELLELIRRGEIDMLPMMFWTEQRAREFSMTLPYFTIRHYVFMNGEQSDIKSLDDLSGMTMAIPAGYSSIEYLSEHYPEISILEVSGVVEAMDAVVTGEADAVIENLASIAYFSANQSIVGLKPTFKVRFDSNNIAMATRNDIPLLRDILQKALNEISTEGTTQIMAKWTGSEAAAKSFLTSKAELSAAESNRLKNTAQLTACVNHNRMPMETAAKDYADGMTSDYLAAIGATLNVHFIVRSYATWSEIKASLISGKCDVATLALNTTEKDSEIVYSTSHITEKLALATRSDSTFIDDLQDLPETKLGVVQGYVTANELQRAHPKIRFVAYASIEEALDQIETGELFGVIDNISALNYALRKRTDRKLKIGGIFSNYEVSFSIATSSDDALLASAVDKALRAVPDALHSNIQRKWVAVSIEKETDYTLLWRSLAVALVALIFIIARFIELRRHREEIQQKNLTLREINTKLEQQTDSALHMAYHDPLTGLPNRAKLMQELDSAIKLSTRNKSALAVLFIDLDRFKPINDTLGHAIGDKVLKAVASTINSLLRDTDMLCRIGGDEFIVVLQSISDSYSPSIVAQRIINALSEPFRIDQHDINLGSSIGIALLHDDSDELHSIIKCADSAMYTAKENGRNRYAYYREEMSNKAARRTEIEAALRRSIKEQGFTLVFQPIIDLEKREVVKAEALIRWNHPTLGPVPPDEFIPIAEDVGLIVEIGDRVLRRACEAMRGFRREGTRINSIAVNVSSVEFTKSDVAARFRDTLKKYNVRPEQIEIEITERHMLDPTQGAETELQKLRELGHIICVDDFGTGYSSLSYMKQLPINVIKIDRSFISDIPHDQNDVAISQAIISLSHNLGYKVVAEGVETKEQMDYLIEKCCNYAQGYYFAKPVPAEEFSKTVREIKERLNVNPHWTAKLKALRG